MKKVYYLLTFLAAAALFSACKPMSKTYDELGDIPKPTAPVVTPPTIASMTLTATDYAKLPASNVASTQLFFHGTTDAFASIPTILTKTYPSVGNNSQINVTYSTSPAVPPALTLADNNNANVAITLQTGLATSDYKFTTGFTYTPAVGSNISVTAVTFEDLSAAQALNWLRNRYKTLVTPANTTTTPATLAVYKPATTLANNTLVVLTYLYFESNVTASTGNLTTDAFLYTTANDWQKIYRVNTAQYTSVNRGTNQAFLVADLPNLPSYINTFLKADPTVMLTAKVGDVVYVNYKLFVSSTSSTQEVLPFAYDGTNWITATTATTLTNLFTYTNGVWTGQLDNTVYYTFVPADYTAVAGNTTLGASATAITNLNTNGNFILNGTTTRWTDAQIANGIIGVLKTLYTAPATNQKFIVTVKTYSQYSTEVFNFAYNGTTFVYNPIPDNAKYQLTGDDYDNISKLTTTGASAAAMSNLQGFGDFSLSGSTAWTDAQINIGIATVLKTRYTAATTNQTIVVTYVGYNGGNRSLTRTFKYDGANWIAQ